jgi:hypothetical protein
MDARKLNLIGLDHLNAQQGKKAVVEMLNESERAIRDGDKVYLYQTDQETLDEVVRVFENPAEFEQWKEEYLNALI